MNRLFHASAAAALLVSASVASAVSSHTFNISGLTTDSGFLTSFPTLTHNAGAALTINNVAFDVNYEAFDPSWRSEVQIAIDTDDDDSFDGDIDLSDFGAPDSAGTFAASGSVPANTVSSNGLIYLTLYEAFNDPLVSPDAVFGQSSTVTVTYTLVPEPTTLATLGLAGLGLTRRRR